MAKRREVPPTARGYNAYEVVSAYQKAIRRSDVDSSIYWGAEGYRSYPAWMWKRLKIIVSEDIGPAAPGLPADVAALYETSGGEKGGLMFFVHATILAARSPKSRIVDWALFAVANDKQPKDREIPDEALDKHTLRGKQQGRGAAHFVDEGAKLVQPEYPVTGEGGRIPWDIRDLEEKYRKVFKRDQAGWRDPVEEDDKPPKQRRFLP